MFRPAYIDLYDRGELKERVERALNLLSECQVCPRVCKAKRLDDEKTGTCKLGRFAIVSSFGPHFGEERPLVGYYGSGTIFFARCNLRCIFCQNYDISQLGYGEEVTPKELAGMMLSLQRSGCHNINFVTPSHVVPQILEALSIAIPQGLSVPLVYNTSGYDSLETLKLLDGVVDIYMPDLKYSSNQTAAKLSRARNYPEVAREAIREMHRQVGDLKLDGRGIAIRGLLVRHLVLPENLAGTKEVAKFISEEISKETYVNVMDQYRPCYLAHKVPALRRRIMAKEYHEAVRAFLSAGVTRLDGLLT